MINAALLDANRIITNVIVLESLDQHPEAVVCPPWCGVGMSIDTPEPVVTAVPSIVTMRQARLALLQVGLLDSVNAAVAAADEATKITWEFSSMVERNHPFVATLTAALNLTSQQLDDLFTLAATL